MLTGEMRNGSCGKQQNEKEKVVAALGMLGWGIRGERVSSTRGARLPHKLSISSYSNCAFENGLGSPSF